MLDTVRGFKATKYELRDEDDGGTYNLTRQSIVALGASSKGGAELKKNTIVLAMYPDTTVFYKAMVVKPPGRKVVEYMLTFQDDAGGSWSQVHTAVPKQNVIKIPAAWQNQFLS